ncbi:hypothetical protein Dimus_035741, partial [Dionaea muscipula]
MTIRPHEEFRIRRERKKTSPANWSAVHPQKSLLLDGDRSRFGEMETGSPVNPASHSARRKRGRARRTRPEVQPVVEEVLARRRWWGPARDNAQSRRRCSLRRRRLLVVISSSRGGSWAARVRRATRWSLKSPGNRRSRPRFSSLAETGKAVSMMKSSCSSGLFRNL